MIKIWIKHGRGYVRLGGGGQCLAINRSVKQRIYTVNSGQRRSATNTRPTIAIDSIDVGPYTAL